MNAITKISILKDAELFRRQTLIGGVWQDARTDATVEVVDPASLTDRRLRHHHAVEFPERHDHAQGRACPGGGLHGGH